MNFKKTLLASLLMISASGAFAAETATLLVKGTIAPTVCNVTLGSTGGQAELTFDVADYTGAQKVLEPQTIPFKIACSPNATAVTYTVFDDASSPNPSSGSFGLGQHNEAEIGRFSMVLGDVKVDNVLARSILGTGNGLWSVSSAVIKSSAGINSFASADGAVVPVNAKDFSATLSIRPTINANLPVNDEIELNGSATITITQI